MTATYLPIKAALPNVPSPPSNQSHLLEKVHGPSHIDVAHGPMPAAAPHMYTLSLRLPTGPPYASTVIGGGGPGF